jgi:glutamine amidotransferase
VICIVDSGVANLGSLVNAFSVVGSAVHVTRDPEVVERASAIVLPGVGAFGDAIQVLRNNGLADAIQRATFNGASVLGICLGLQLLMETSDEFGSHEGLALIGGSAERLPDGRPGTRVPNIGWRRTRWSGSATLGPEGLDGDDPYYYYVHGYHVVPTDRQCTVATTDFGGLPVVVAVQSGRIMGVQFHPEKSQSAGLRLLDRFSRMVSA